MKVFSKMLMTASILSSALACATYVHAHITLENQQAAAGSYYKATFKVSHGCEGSPTRQIVVHVPKGVHGAKPMPKAGWKIEISKLQLDTPYTSHGRTRTEDVNEIRWTGGPLADNFYDEFVLVAKLPEQPGALYWKVSQICEHGRTDWADVPAEGKKLSDYKTPAVLLEVVPGSHQEHRH